MDILFPGNWPTPRDLPRALFRRRWVRFIASLIAERRAMGTDPANPRDLFDLMVAARDPETGEGFSDENLGDQVATMILAGHETTATALFWSLYLLALDPETQDRVASEARTVAAGGEPDFSRLAFTRAVIDETVRLYPPAFIIARAAKGRDIIDGRSVRKGDVVIISPWLLHRHKKLWREPDVFMPARFMPGAPPPDKFAYLPFGVGPRVCIGAHFALTEATLALSRIVGTFNVSLLGTRPAIPLGVVTTQPDHSPEFRIERR
jgi:cytochrome P450